MITNSKLLNNLTKVGNFKPKGSAKFQSKTPSLFKPHAYSIVSNNPSYHNNNNNSGNLNHEIKQKELNKSQIKYELLDQILHKLNTEPEQPKHFTNAHMSELKDPVVIIKNINQENTLRKKLDRCTNIDDFILQNRDHEI